MKKIMVLVLAMLMILSGSVLAAPATVETADSTTEDGTLAVEITEDTAVVAAETGYDVPDGSKLVFEMNFNNGATVANYKAVDTYGSYGADFVKDGGVPSIVEGTNDKTDIYLDFANVTAVANASTKDSTVYSTINDAIAITNKVTIAEGKTSAEAYPLIYLRAGDGTNNNFADGRYTLFAKVKVAENENVSTVKYGPLYYNGGDKGVATTGYQKFFELNMAENVIKVDVYACQGKFYTYKTDGTLVKIADLTKGKLSKFGVIIVPNFTASSSSVVFVDDIKLYYQPVECAPGTANIYFDANGKTVENLPATVNKNVGTVDISTFVKLSDVGTSRFVGWSDKKDGKILASYDLQKSTTLYAIWDDYYYAPAGEGKNDELVFASHFNSTYTTFNGKLVSDTKISSVGPALSKISTDTVSFGSGTSRANYELKDISNADDELVLTTKGTNASETWPALWLNAKSPAVLADGIYTWYAEISVMSDNELEYIKFNPAASCKLSGTNKNLSGIKFDLPVDGTKIYATITAAVDNGNVYFGTNLTKFSGTYDVGTLYRIGWNFNVKAKTGTETNTKIFIDNLRVYYRPIHKALSYDENSIRVNTHAGIRFKSSISKLTRGDETLAEYGFIVTRKNFLDNKNVSPADFTMDNENVTYVKGVSYGMDNGKKVDRIFEDDGVNTFFTAVVYNIPADMYDEVLVVRPYVSVDSEIIYGEPMSASILEVAERLKSSDSYEEYKETVDKILNGEEI